MLYFVHLPNVVSLISTLPRLEKSRAIDTNFPMSILLSAVTGAMQNIYLTWREKVKFSSVLFFQIQI